MSNKKILIVEDDANIRDVLKLALEFEGYEVVTAKNGKEGLDLLAETDPGLILLDLMMPIMNGWEFVDHLKEKNLYAKYPVIVVSAYSERAKIIECRDFVQKPLELEELLTSVKTHYGAGQA
jgi:two-component system response regulator MprA